MMYYGHTMNGWGIAWMSVGMLLYTALIVAVLVVLIRLTPRTGEPAATPRPPGAEEALAHRFARGEIDEREYAARLAVLRQS